MTDNDLIVYQANAFTESRQSYTLNEKRLLQTLIASVKKEDKEFRRYPINIKEFAKLANLDPSNLYGYAKEIATSLMHKTFTVESGEKFSMFHLVDEADYDGGNLTLELSKKTFDIFLALKDTKNYTTYELTEFMTLKSTYAQRIYELVKQYERSNTKERSIPLDKLRGMLGIADDEYLKFNDFKKRVLELSHKSITTDTELRYEWEPIKPSRKIEGIRFFNIVSDKKEDVELSKFKVWFHREFKDYEGALVGTLYDGEIYLNKKGWFEDARDKKHKFTKDEIDRIWLGLMEKRYVLEETIRVRTKRNTNLATPKKEAIPKLLEAEIIEENPNQGILDFDAEIDCSPQMDLSDLTAKEILEIAFEDNATFASQEEMEEDIAFEKEAIKQGFLARIGGFLTVVKEGFPTMPNEKGR